MDLLSKARQLSESLKKLASEAQRLEFSGTLDYKAVERVYEFYVDLLALHSVLRYWDLKLVNHSGDKMIRFPHGPAGKSEFPYFEARTKGQRGVSGRVEFQVCLGTKILGPNGSTYAPDLSIQVGDSPGDPSSVHFVFGWDQKHTSYARLDRDEVVKVAGLLLVVPCQAQLDVMPFCDEEWPNQPCVITNAGRSTLADSDLRSLGVCEVFSCWPGMTRSVRPQASGIGHAP